MKVKISNPNKKNEIWIYSAIALATVILLGWILRAQITLAGELIPGINGAYYPVQVRSILQTGFLGIPDFPLLFYADAAIAAVISIFVEQSEAIMTTVRWADTLFPVLLTIPIFLFANAFPSSDKNKYAPVLATFFVGLIAVSNTSLLRMAGGFQKNAAGIPLSLSFFYFFYQALSHQKKRDIFLAAFFLVVTCLTHIGVAALTLTMTGLMVLISLISHPNKKRLILIAIGLLALLGLILGGAYLIDPTRIERLLGIIFDPAALFAQSNLGGISDSISSISLDLTGNGILLWGNILGGLGILIAIFHHKVLKPAERSLLWAASLTALFFAFPLISKEWSGRLAMMSFVPGLIPLTYLVTRQFWGWIIALIFAIAIAYGTLNSRELRVSNSIKIDGYNELVGFDAYIPEEDALILAPHGTEWWVAWILETDIANRLELAVEAWDDYDAIYVIEPNQGYSGPQNINQNKGNPPTSRPQPLSPQQFGQGDYPGNNNFPNQQNSPLGNFRLTGLSEEDSVLISGGIFYTLSKIEEKPVILQGGGAPDLKGALNSSSADLIIIDGQEIVINENTVISQRGEIVSINDLTLGTQVFVWGESSLFGDQLTADYVMANPVRLLQENPVGQMPPQNQFPQNPANQIEGGTVSLGSLEMVTRRAWGANPINFEAKNETGYFHPENNPTGVLRYRESLDKVLNTIVLHHSAFTETKTPLELQELHQNKKGYADIGYHFLIDQAGILYQGRSIELRGAHVESYNTGTIGVMLAGNFNIAEATQAQLDTLNGLLIYLKEEYSISFIAGHEDFNPDITVCPGEILKGLIPDLAEKIGFVYGTEGYTPPPWQ